ncbi:hypothetical protein EV174_006352 [Coemansia sp. RSA 2320]|nr:hypothetical protein EV174_006352 [Coemansia sp. RSA 2320]
MSFMRVFVLLAILSCSMLVHGITYIGINNKVGYKVYSTTNTICQQVDPRYNATSNSVSVSGFPTSFFANKDCTYLVTIAYNSASKFQDVPRNIQSFSTLGGW